MKITSKNKTYLKWGQFFITNEGKVQNKKKKTDKKRSLNQYWALFKKKNIVLQKKSKNYWNDYKNLKLNNNWTIKLFECRNGDRTLRYRIQFGLKNKPSGLRYLLFCPHHFTTVFPYVSFVCKKRKNKTKINKGKIEKKLKKRKNRSSYFWGVQKKNENKKFGEKYIYYSTKFFFFFCLSLYRF